MKHPLNNRAGLTLAEVVVAMFLFAIGMLGLFAISSQLRSLRNLSEGLTDATLLAETTLENLRARGAAAIVSATNGVGNFVVVSTLVSNSGYASKHVCVQVSWPDLRGQTHSVSINSVVAP